MAILTAIAPVFSQTSGEKIDLSKYSGKWYVISSIPTRFDKNWENVTETYKVVNAGKIKIETGYSVGSGGQVKTVGSKGFVRSEDNALWKVQFVWPFRADYLIEEVGEDYSYAVVGHRRQKYFYILSRAPQLEENLRAAIIKRYSQKGYDMAKLRNITHNLK